MALALVNVKATCLNGPAEGKVLHYQTFERTGGTIWYWVIIPTLNEGTGWWYREDCLEVTQGQLPTSIPDKRYRHRITKAGNTAFFDIDAETKQVLIKDGFSVTYEPPES